MANATIQQNLTQVKYALYKSPMNALLLNRQLGKIFRQTFSIHHGWPPSSVLYNTIFKTITTFSSPCPLIWVPCAPVWHGVHDEPMWKTGCNEIENTALTVLIVSLFSLNKCFPGSKPLGRKVDKYFNVYSDSYFPSYGRDSPCSKRNHSLLQNRTELNTAQKTSKTKWKSGCQ